MFQGLKQPLIRVARLRADRYHWRLGRQGAFTEMVNELLWREQRSRLVEKQCVAPPRGPAAGVTGNNPDRTLLLNSAASRDQGTALLRALHHHHRTGQGDKQTVTSCEMTSSDRCRMGLLSQQQALLTNRCLQPAVMAGIRTVEGGSKHRDGRPACVQTGAKGRSIDPLGKATQYRPARQRKCATEFSSCVKAMGRCGSGADHGNTALLGNHRQELRTTAMKQGQRRPL